MASIRKDVVIDAAPAVVWDAVRDTGTVHRRLVRGFVVHCRQEGAVRLVTFANGATARELIVDVDDAARRLAHASVGGRLTHHHASMQVVLEADGSSRLVWITDLLPDDLAAAAMKATLEQR